MPSLFIKTSSPSLQVPSQELCLAIAKTPVLLLIPTNSNDQIIAIQPAFCFQSISQSRVQSLFDLRISPLLKDLDENKLVCSLEA